MSAQQYDVSLAVWRGFPTWIMLFNSMKSAHYTVHSKPGPDDNSYLIQESWIQLSRVKYASQEACIYFSVSLRFLTWLCSRWSMFDSPGPCSPFLSQMGVVIGTWLTVYDVWLPVWCLLYYMMPASCMISSYLSDVCSTYNVSLAVWHGFPTCIMSAYLYDLKSTI